MHTLFKLLFFLLLPALALPAAAQGEPATAATAVADSLSPGDSAVARRLAILLDDDIFERTQVGLYVYDLTADRPVFAFGHRQLMRPASCQKIVTAVTALAQLGADYTYATSLYLSGHLANDTLRGGLSIRAGFDPRFGHDDLNAFVQALKDLHVKAVCGDVLLDVSIKDTLRWGWGWCWDDDETPLTPLLYKGREGFPAALGEALAEAGVALCGRIREGRVPADARLLVKRTHGIEQILRPMLKESDNLYAESLFAQIGAQDGRAYADRRQAQRAFNSFIRHIGLDPSHYLMADGSGLSLYNYLTPELLVEVLRYAYRHEEIYFRLSEALPLAGRDGTLRSRMRNSTACGNVRAKTGTVEGVSTLAGYATAGNGHVLCFAVMNQGIRHTATGRNFQDRVCAALTQADGAEEE